MLKAIFKNKSLDEWIKIVLIGGIFIVSISAINYSFLKPWKAEKNIKNCLAEKETKARELWKQYCRLTNAQIGTDGSCLLDDDTSNEVRARWNSAKEDCFKLYK